MFEAVDLLIAPPTPHLPELIVRAVSPRIHRDRSMQNAPTFQPCDQPGCICLQLLDAGSDIAQVPPAIIQHPLKPS
jgi:hypothetical protein